MARINNLSDFLTDVASAIKTKKGDNSSIAASEFDTEILNLPSQGEYQSKSVVITSNGDITITPDENFDALEQITITTNVPIKRLQTKSYTFTENTNITLTPEIGYDGFEQVGITINVPHSEGTWEYFEANIPLSGNNYTDRVGAPATVYLDTEGSTVDGSNTWYYRTYLRFAGLDSIIANKVYYQISNATLSFKIKSGNDNWKDSEYICTRPATMYTPSTLCWNNQPNPMASPVVTAKMTKSAINDWIILDITSIISEMIAADDNKGLLLKAKSEGSYRHNWQMYAMGAEESFRPYLTLKGLRFVDESSEYETNLALTEQILN